MSDTLQTGPAARPLRVTCVGAGWATRERHLPALAADPRVRVLGVIDPHPERAAASRIASRLRITARRWPRHGSPTPTA